MNKTQKMQERKSSLEWPGKWRVKWEMDGGILGGSVGCLVGNCLEEEDGKLQFSGGKRVTVAISRLWVWGETRRAKWRKVSLSVLLCEIHSEGRTITKLPLWTIVVMMWYPYMVGWDEKIKIPILSF